MLRGACHKAIQFGYRYQASRCFATTWTSSLPLDCESCNGSVKEYSRHVLVKTHVPPTSWPSKIELLPFVGSLATALAKADKSGVLTGKTKLTLAYNREYVRPPMGRYELLLFPGGRCLKDITEDDVGQVVAALREPDTQEAYARDVLVCVHGNKDVRCGDVGPRVLARLRDLVQEANASAPAVHLWECSHIGGHKYAGNIIVYPEGDWYGNLRSEADVEVVAATHILRPMPGPVDVEHRFWRGGMTTST